MTVPKPRDRRAAIRFDKVFRVLVSSEDFGEVSAVARNISSGGMLIETPAPLPLGSELRVHFEIPDSRGCVVARAEVKNHYAFNYCEHGEVRSARGMGVRFLEFLEESATQLRMSMTLLRTLH
ncbi:MAG: PilZ domain-containing protein [Deltaproteobacteria bacterium]|nr:PilZ domain-containing protein [Deltaproteobacteria bacterium]